MLHNYFKIALLTLRRRKGYAVLNLAGLAIGLACCLLIGLFIIHALSFDRFHEKADRIYRLTYENRIGEDLPSATPEEYRVWGSAAIAPLLANDFPEVEHTVRVSGQHHILVSRDQRRFQEERYLFADSTFFKVFTFPLLEGDPATALAQPGSIVLTENAAQRYFGNKNAMGLTLDVDGNDFVVSGVMAEVPATSHLDFDMLLSMISFEQSVRQAGQDYMFDNWGYVDFFTYILLRKGAAPEAIAAKFPDFIDQHLTASMREPAQTYNLALEPLIDAYLSPVGGRQPGPKGNPDTLYLFSFIGLFILLIACINFMNLATARSAQRAKEVGVRKTLGALRSGLVGQFLTEAVLLALAAMVLAYTLLPLLLPVFRALAGSAISAEPLGNPLMLLGLLGVALVVGLVAGSYPAFALASFRPARVLKGTFSTSKQGAALRQVLVVFQFAIAIVLIASTLVVRAQLDHMRSRPLGFDAEQQLVLDFGADRTVRQQLESIKAELAAHPAVRSVAATRSIPGGYFPHGTTQVETPSGTMQEFEPGVYEVGFDFLPNLGVTIVAGRVFDPAFPTDSTQALVLNETAVHHLGYADPEAIIGKRFEQWGREGEVIGVVKDFNYESLRNTIEPLTFRFSTYTGLFVLNVATDDLRTTLDDLESTWAVLVPNRPFLYHFLDASFDALYRDDERFGQLFGLFAALAIFLACLGLFGLTAYTTQQRTKEIGVRKVLGASVPGLVRLLSKDLVRLVAIGFIVATPVAYFSMKRWLDDFAYQTALRPGFFMTAGFIAMAIALMTMSYHAIRASLADPVQSLRDE